MPNYDVQVRLKHENGLPEDIYVNSLHYESGFPDTLEGLCDDINAGYVAIQQFLTSEINGMEIRVYPPGLNPGGPTFSKSYANLFGGGAAGVPEVAVCLSYATEDNPDASGPRSRGRIYVGPLSTTSGSRPSVSIRDAVLDLGESLASAGNAANTTWMLYSVLDASYKKIESIWCDDAWDTQRRRGLKPSTREVRDVQ